MCDTEIANALSGREGHVTVASGAVPLSATSDRNGVRTRSRNDLNLRIRDGWSRREAAVAGRGRGRLKKAVIRAVKAAECRGDLLSEVEPRAGVAPDHFRPKFAFRHFEKRFAGTMQWHEIIGANLLQG